MAFVKNKIKLARDALGKKDYISAKDAAEQVLGYEPDNYHANVFLGLALSELGEKEGSEKAYQKAIELNPEQQLAWQGLSKLYERAEGWENYGNTLQKLMDLCNNPKDVVKCAETLQRFVDFQRERGTRLQLVEALILYLPDSSLSSTLSHLPAPDPTNPTSTTTYTAQAAVHDTLPILEEIVALLEAHENGIIIAEVEKRRNRLGAASPEQLKKEVGRSIWGKSQLPTFYNEILNHPNTSDTLRRETDAKLLRYKQCYLNSLPDSPEFAEERSKVVKEVDQLVDGIVLLKIPDEAAWMFFLEGKNYDINVPYDHGLFQQFIQIFPGSPVTKLLRGYFTFYGLSGIQRSESPIEANVNDTEDAFDIIVNLQLTLTDCILAKRILADIYLKEEDYENAIKVSEGGLLLVSRFESENAKMLPGVRTLLNIVLSTSLVHLFPPKHHNRALRIIDGILFQHPKYVGSLMGRGYILQAAEEWKEAAMRFAEVQQILPNDSGAGLRAREEHAWCIYHAGMVEEGTTELKSALDTLNDIEYRDADLARCLWRLGKCYWQMGGTECEGAYRLFIAALKRKPDYAPAFTSLGFYYSEYASPPDPIRASKCFQKAFELDPREFIAAKKLVEGFAEDREWDLVEVVAKRTIEGEGGSDIVGSDSAAVSRYLPRNAWAWKALGVVELHRRNYGPAIQAFQITLRAELNDQSSWLRLGEAYSRAGRHAAAAKALGRARELNPHDWICSYLVGNVHRQMGNFADAIASFEPILDTRPTEIGVLFTLGNTYLELASHELQQGFYARSEGSAIHAIHLGLKAIQESPGFRSIVWKTIADSVFLLSQQSTFYRHGDVHAEIVNVLSNISIDTCSHLAGIIPSLPGNDSEVATKLVLEVAAAAYDHRVSLGSLESSARSSAWYDLGIALHSWVARSDVDPKKEKVMEQAIFCLEQAIREEAVNDRYWVALGNAYFLSRAGAAQHAYINALEIDSKNVTTWTNFGLLCLHHGDTELANQALYRAQTIDPDCALAWVGQALVASANGHEKDAKNLFEHAVSLPGNVPEGDLEFSRQIFDSQTGVGQKPAVGNLLPAFFVLDRYCKRRPQDVTALHLFALICEHLGLIEVALETIARAITILESMYEETEDAEIELQFTIATTNMARLRLANQDYEGAIESFESVLGLLQEDGKPATKIIRVQAQLGSGLAFFLRGDLERALPLFEGASTGEDSTIRGHATIMLAKVMWAIGTEEFRESAKALLLECITTDPDNVPAIMALAGMGILTDDSSLVDAALSEILVLPLEQRRESDPGREISYLLRQYHLAQGDTKGAFRVAQAAVVIEPSQSQARNDLAELLIQRGDYGSALALAQSHAPKGVEETRSTRLQAIAHALCKSEGDSAQALHKAQRSIMLSPSAIRGWQTLAYVRSGNT
ncbi:TPR-like protein [Infundibulicybe gibba]|nr:TPR-like protein [Infundibulicybe gibba]